MSASTGQTLLEEIKREAEFIMSSVTPSKEKRRMASTFGVTPETCVLVWRKIDPANSFGRSAKTYHLLWAIYWLKVYPTEEQGRSPIGGVDEQTFRTWVKKFVTAISFLEYPIILWDARFLGDIGNDALVTIDGTDMRVEKSFDKRFFSHKFHSGGLRYEVGVCIMSGHIVWINGPFRCGMNDISIARQSVIGNLTENEMVEADNGYCGENWTIRTPAPQHYRTEKEHIMKGNARGRHETVNERFKNFNVMAHTFRHPLERHSASFRAVAVLVQLSIENGSPLFPVEYYDDDGRNR